MLLLWKTEREREWEREREMKISLTIAGGWGHSTAASSFYRANYAQEKIFSLEQVKKKNWTGLNWTELNWSTRVFRVLFTVCVPVTNN